MTQYSDAQKAEVLALYDANGSNAYRTAKQTGIPRSTLMEWVNGRVNDDVPRLRQEKRGELADLFEAELHAIFGVLPGKRDEATYQQLATSAGIFTDKMRLLRGLPTEIVQLLPDVLVALRKLGQEPADVFNAIIARAADDASGEPLS